MENEHCILLNELYITWTIIICYIKEKLNVIYCSHNASGHSLTIDSQWKMRNTIVIIYSTKYSVMKIKKHVIFIKYNNY